MIDLPLQELKTYKGISPRPKDFEAYWDKALCELDTVEPDPIFKPADFTAKGVECFHLTFRGVRGATIHAKYLRPQSQGKHPALLAFHGYNMDSGDWSGLLQYVHEGICVFAMDCRGQGGLSEDVGGVKGNTKDGQIIRGIWDDPQDLLFRHIFLDTVQLYRVAKGLPEVDQARMATYGVSQGGGLSTACSGLTGAMKLSVIQYPFLTDYKRPVQMGLHGTAYQEILDYFRHFDPMHENEDALFERLGYIDVHFLAERINNKALVAIGLNDVICPPSTSFAVYNALKGEKRLCVFPEYGHEYYPKFGDIVFSFLQGL